MVGRETLTDEPNIRYGYQIDQFHMVGKRTMASKRLTPNQKSSVPRDCSDAPRYVPRAVLVRSSDGPTTTNRRIRKVVWTALRRPAGSLTTPPPSAQHTRHGPCRAKSTTVPNHTDGYDHTMGTIHWVARRTMQK